MWHWGIWRTTFAIFFCDKQHNIISFTAHGPPYYQERIPISVKITLWFNFNLFIFLILSVLVVWPRNDNTVFGKVKLDFASFLFQQSQIKTWLCNLLKWKYRTYTIIIFSKFHFISFLSLLLLNSILLKETLNTFAPMPRSLGDWKMRNTGCPKNLIKSGTVYCCFVIKFCFPGCLTRLVINGARIFLAGWCLMNNNQVYRLV